MAMSPTVIGIYACGLRLRPRMRRLVLASVGASSRRSCSGSCLGYARYLHQFGLSCRVAAELITLQAGDHLTRESLHEAELVDHAGKEHELTEALSV